MQPGFGDSLLMAVHGDYFRKFIKDDRERNKLEHFLGTMDKQNAGTVMKSFVLSISRIPVRKRGGYDVARFTATAAFLEKALPWPVISSAK